MKRFQQQPAIWSSCPIGEIQRLTGAVKNTWRPRVGDWRVFYTDASVSRTIVVASVLHSSQAYKLTVTGFKLRILASSDPVLHREPPRCQL